MMDPELKAMKKLSVFNVNYMDTLFKRVPPLVDFHFVMNVVDLVSQTKTNVQILPASLNSIQKTLK